MSENPEDKSIKITLIDLIDLIKRHKGLLISCTAAFSIWAGLYTLSNPIRYKAESTFREKGKSTVSLDSTSITAAFFNHQKPESASLAIIKSRSVTDDVIYTQGLQAHIDSKKEPLWISKVFSNLLIEKAHFDFRLTPLFHDQKEPFLIRDVYYRSDLGKSFDLIFTTDTTFDLLQNGRIVTSGDVRKPVSFQDATFTVTLKDPIAIGQKYSVYIEPYPLTLEKVKNAFDVAEDKKDRSILKFTYKGSNRVRAQEIVNAFMASYQAYLKKEHERDADLQLAYLETREEESLKQLLNMMEEMANNQAKEATLLGFADAERALEFLSQHQLQCQNRLMDIQLEKDLLVQASGQSTAKQSGYFSLIALPFFKDSVTKLIDFKERRDAITLGLKERTSLPADRVPMLQAQLQVFNDTDDEIKQIEAVLHKVHETGSIEDAFDGLNQSYWPLRLWKASISERENGHDIGIKDFLENLRKLLLVQQQLIKDSFIYPVTLNADFEGIELGSVNQLFQLYAEEMHSTQTKMRQIDFLLLELADEEFALSSLSTVLDDNVGSTLAAKASELVMAQRDPINRSPKEQERIGDELKLQRGFFVLHLEQNKELLHLKEQVLREKMKSLQEVTLSLLNRQIALVESQLQGAIDTRRKALVLEKELYEKTLQDIAMKVALFSKKGVSEKFFKQQMELRKELVGEMTRLVEGKNVTANLEILQSAPLDAALAPILPESPRLIFFLILGAICGCMIGLCTLFTKVSLRGLPLTLNQLRSFGKKTAGLLSSKFTDTNAKALSDADMATLRKISVDIKESQSSLILLDGKTDFSKSLATILSESGQKCLILSFDLESRQMPNGLYDYFKGLVKEPEIFSENGFDHIVWGAPNRFAFDTISNVKMQKLLNSLNSQGYHVLGVMPEGFESTEANLLAPYFDKLVVGLNHEVSVQEMINWPFFDKDSIFVFVDA